MKQLEFSTSKGEWLLVDGCEHGLITDKEQASRLINAWGTDNVERDLDGTELICKLSDITEEQASEVIGVYDIRVLYKLGESTDKYVNMSTDQSLCSLIKSKGVHLFENPIDKPEYPNQHTVNNLVNKGYGEKDFVDLKYDMYQHDQSEANTFYNPYLFKKI